MWPDRKIVRIGWGCAMDDETQPVVALRPYPYDLAFYARLGEPLVVVDDWLAPRISERDDWRKELADAGHFAPDVARLVLVPPAALPARLCTAGVTWVLTETEAAAIPAWLAGAERVHAGRDGVLWRLDATTPATMAALGCTPPRRSSLSPAP